MFARALSICSKLFDTQPAQVPSSTKLWVPGLWGPFRPVAASSGQAILWVAVQLMTLALALCRLLSVT